MFIVTLAESGFATQYISMISYRGYDHVSDVRSTPVREQAYQFTDRKEADDAAAASERGGRCRASVEEI